MINIGPVPVSESAEMKMYMAKLIPAITSEIKAAATIAQVSEKIPTKATVGELRYFDTIAAGVIDSVGLYVYTGVKWKLIVNSS